MAARNQFQSASDEDLKRDEVPEERYQDEAKKEDLQEDLPDDHQFQSAPDNEAKKEMPGPVGFWDPRLRKVRFEVAWKWALTTLTLMIFILCVLSLFWGALFHVNQNLEAFQVAVVDFDGQIAPYSNSGVEPVFGPAVIEVAKNQAFPTIGWMVMDPAEFNYDPINVRQAVYDEHFWLAVIVNANATYEANMALQNGDESYDPTGAAQLIYVDARDSDTFDNYILPFMTNFAFEAQAAASKAWGAKVFAEVANDATLQSNLARAPTIVSPGFGFSQFDLRPFFPYTAVPSQSVGLIYLIILSFFSFSFYLPIYMKLVMPNGHPPLKGMQLVIVRYLGIITAYFFCSLAYSLVSVAFLIDFSTWNPVRSDTEVIVTVGGYTNAPKYGAATFLVYWTLNWVGMIALGLACENVAMFLGMPWTGMWLIFWVITNVATSFYSIQAEPTFYYWGYAWPLHQVVEGTRCLLWDLHNRLGLNFGILLAWGAVNTALFPIACRYMKWKKDKGIKEYWA